MQKSYLLRSQSESPLASDSALIDPNAYSHTSGRGHGSLSAEATFSLPSLKGIAESDLTLLLRSAWVDARYNLHPLLAAVSNAPADILDTRGYSLYYPLVDTESAFGWAEETVFQHPPTTMLALVCSLKDLAPTAKSSRASLHFAYSDTGDTIHVVLVAGHWITDGLGSFTIINRISEYLNNPVEGVYKWGEEIERLSVPLVIATGRRTAREGQLVPLPPAQVDRVLAAMMGGAGAMEPSYTQDAGAHELPQTKQDVIHELSLSVLDSHALLELCRSHSVTITALLSVLLALVFVGDDERISESKNVQLPFFSINRGADLLDGYKSSVGLQLTLSPFAFNAQAVKDCLGDGDYSGESQIWKLAATAKDQLVSAKVSILCSLESSTDRLRLTILPSYTSMRLYALYSPIYSRQGVIRYSAQQYHS